MFLTLVTRQYFLDQLRYSSKQHRLLRKSSIIYTYLINTNFNFIIVRNNKILSLIIFRYYRVNSIIKYKAKEEYSINVKNYFLTTKVYLIKNFIIANFINLLNLKSIIKKIKVNLFLEIKLFNEIIIYNKSKYVKIIRYISKKNLKI